MMRCIYNTLCDFFLLKMPLTSNILLAGLSFNFSVTKVFLVNVSDLVFLHYYRLFTSQLDSVAYH